MKKEIKEEIREILLEKAKPNEPIIKKDEWLIATEILEIPEIKNALIFVQKKKGLLKKIKKLLDEFIPEKIQENEFKKELEWLIYDYAPFLVEERLQELSQKIIDLIKKVTPKNKQLIKCQKK